MVNPIHCRAYSGDKIIHSAIKCRINNIGPISIFELFFSTKKFYMAAILNFEKIFCPSPYLFLP